MVFVLVLVYIYGVCIGVGLYIWCLYWCRFIYMVFVLV